MPKMRDSSFSPFTAPTKKGVHPHTFVGTKETYKDPHDQHGYEFIGDYEQVAPHPKKKYAPEHKLVKAPAVQKQGTSGGLVDWFFEHPFVSLMGLAATIFAANKMLGEKGETQGLIKNPDDGEVHTERAALPSTPVSPASPVTVVVNTCSPLSSLPEVKVTEVKTPKAVEVPQPTVSTPSGEGKMVVVEKKKKRHPRVTTQARTPEGKFLPAGTSRKKKVEGISGAAAKAMLEKAKKK